MGFAANDGFKFKLRVLWILGILAAKGVSLVLDGWLDGWMGAHTF
jgi:hypothetical protein